jgi:hypothetical protein
LVVEQHQTVVELVGAPDKSEMGPLRLLRLVTQCRLAVLVAFRLDFPLPLRQGLLAEHLVTVMLLVLLMVVLIQTSF